MKESSLILGLNVYANAFLRIRSYAPGLLLAELCYSFTTMNDVNLYHRDRSLSLKLFSYFSTKTYVMGTQKSRLIETALLSAQNSIN